MLETTKGGITKVQRQLLSQQEIDSSQSLSEIDLEAKVVKHNDLVMARYRLPVNAHRLVCLYVSHLKNPEDPFPLMKLPVSWVADTFPGLRNTNTMYDAIDEALDALYEAGVSFHNGAKREHAEWAKQRWASRVGRNRGYIYIRLSEDLRDYLTQLKKHFTIYELRYIVELRTHYQFRLYEMFKASQYKGYGDVMHEEAKALMDIPADEYQSSAHFRDRILDPSIRHINKVTDVRAEFDRAIKAGRRIIGWRYTIERSRQRMLDLPVNIQPQVERLIAMGLARNEAERWSQQLDEKVLSEVLSYIEGRQANGEISHLRAYARAALQEKWGELPASDAKAISEKQETAVREREREALAEAITTRNKMEEGAAYQVRRKKAYAIKAALSPADLKKLSSAMDDAVAVSKHPRVQQAYYEGQKDDPYLLAFERNFLFEHLKVPETAPAEIQDYLAARLEPPPSASPNRVDRPTIAGPKLRKARRQTA